MTPHRPSAHQRRDYEALRIALIADHLAPHDAAFIAGRAVGLHDGDLVAPVGVTATPRHPDLWAVAPTSLTEAVARDRAGTGTAGD